jgi:hypothetical protein
LNLYNAVHVHGAADSSDEDYLIDDVNPQFFLINVRCTNGTFVTCVLAGKNRLGQLRSVAKNLATPHGIVVVLVIQVHLPETISRIGGGLNKTDECTLGVDSRAMPASAIALPSDSAVQLPLSHLIDFHAI